MNKHNPSVAIVMCVFNEERFVRSAVESILAQSYKNFNFYIINDCSSDRSKEIIEGYKDPRIKYSENAKRLGLGQSLRQICACLNEDYILRMDADDIALPKRLETQLNVAITNEYDMLGTKYIVIDEDDREIGISKYINDKASQNLIGLKSTIGHPTMLIRTAAYKQCGGYSGITPASDYDLITNFVINKYKIGTLDKALLKFRIKRNSTGMINGFKQRKAFNYILKCRKNGLPIDVDKFQEEVIRQESSITSIIYKYSFFLKIKSDKLRLNRNFFTSALYLTLSILISPLQMQVFARLFLFKLLAMLLNLGFEIQTLNERYRD
jgi:glycosyltransferase involved in cell wall biosynthesis